jgi:hypothetical protein
MLVHVVENRIHQYMLGDKIRSFHGVIGGRARQRTGTLFSALINGARPLSLPF